MDAKTWKPRTCKIEVTETELAVLDMLRRHADLAQFSAVKVRGGTWAVALIVDGFYTPVSMAKEQAAWAAEWTGLPMTPPGRTLGPVAKREEGRLMGLHQVDPAMLWDDDLKAPLRALAETDYKPSPLALDVSEAVAAIDDDALLKMMVAQFALTFPVFAGAPEPVQRARNRFVALASAAPEAREAIREVVAWLWDPDENANAQFERIAEEFYRATGYMRPGKDDPLPHSQEYEIERNRAWERWRTDRSRTVLAKLRDALAKMEGH